MTCVVAVVADDYTETHCKDKKQAIVHLFEWSHDSVADECLKVLGPKGYCGVQVSPPNEHIQGGQWWTRCIGRHLDNYLLPSTYLGTSPCPTFCPAGPATGTASSTWCSSATAWA